VVLARLSKEDIDAAYSDISFEVSAREFEKKVRREVEANGSPCIP
jgi:hypothetical protein